MNYLKSLFLSLLLFFVIFSYGCEKDGFDKYIPNDAVVASFVTRFPMAHNVIWDMKGGYDVADFTENGRACEAWFMYSGEWVMTNSEFIYEDLPSSVQRSQRLDGYAEWSCDAIHLLDRSGMAMVFVLETEKDGQETDLFYSSSGLLLRSERGHISQNYEPIFIPPTIKTFVAERYPDAAIAGCRYSNRGVEVDVAGNDSVRILSFDEQLRWRATQYEMAVADVPACVMDAFHLSSFSDSAIERVDYRRTDIEPGVYLFDVKNGERFVSLAIDERGRIRN